MFSNTAATDSRRATLQSKTRNQMLARTAVKAPFRDVFRSETKLKESVLERQKRMSQCYLVSCKPEKQEECLKCKKRSQNFDSLQVHEHTKTLKRVEKAAN